MILPQAELARTYGHPGYWDGGLPARPANSEFFQPRPFDMKLGRIVFEEFAKYPALRANGEPLPRGYNFYPQNFEPGTILTFDHELLVRGGGQAFSGEVRKIAGGKQPLYEYPLVENVPATAEQEAGVYLRRRSLGVILPTAGEAKADLFGFAYDDANTFTKPQLFRVGFYHAPLIVGEPQQSQKTKDDHVREVSERLIAMEAHERTTLAWDHHAENMLRTFRGRLLSLMS